CRGEEAAGTSVGCAGDALLRGRLRWVLVAPLLGGAGHHEFRGRLLEHRSQPTGQTREDRPPRSQGPLEPPRAICPGRSARLARRVCPRSPTKMTDICPGRWKRSSKIARG